MGKVVALRLGGEGEAMLAVRIPKSLHKSIKVACAKEGTTMSAFVLEAVREALAQGKK